MGGVGGKNVDGIAAHAERSGCGVVVVALILNQHQLFEHRVARTFFADMGGENHLTVVLGRAETVNAGNGCDDDHIVAAEQTIGCRQPKALNLCIDGRILFNKGVRLRNVGFRLIVVVVGDEKLDRVVGEERLQLGVELRGERLVVRDHQRGLPLLRDHISNSERLARPRHPFQGLETLTLLQPGAECRNRLRLVAGRLIVRNKLKG